MKVSRLLLLCTITVPAVWPQGSAPTPIAAGQYARTACIKLADGARAADYEKFVEEYDVKRRQASADSGPLLRWNLQRAVHPGGMDSMCDYISVSVYDGFPEPTIGLADSLKKAGLKITSDEYVARRAALTRLVRYDIWRIRAGTGTYGKGHYVVRDFMKVAPGKLNEWEKHVKEIWLPLHTERIKEGRLAAWGAASLFLAGSESPYNASTVNVYREWKHLGATSPGLFQKVHPGKDATEVLNTTGAVRQITRREVYQVVQEVNSSLPPGRRTTAR